MAALAAEMAARGTAAEVMEEFRGGWSEAAAAGDGD